jgi:hypothetical protein
MSTVVKVPLLAAGRNDLTLNASAAAYSECAATEIAISVGDNVPARLRGLVTFNLLRHLALKIPKARGLTLPTSGQVARFGFALTTGAAPRPDGFVYAATAEATAIDEDRIEVLVGSTAATQASRSGLLYSGIMRALEHFRRADAVKA